MIFLALVATWLPDGLWRLILSCSGPPWPSGAECIWKIILNRCGLWLRGFSHAVRFKSKAPWLFFNWGLSDFAGYKTEKLSPEVNLVAAGPPSPGKLMTFLALVATWLPDSLCPEFIWKIILNCCGLRLRGFSRAARFKSTAP